MNDLEIVWNWLREQRIISPSNPHRSQRYAPFILKPANLENMSKEMIEKVIRLATQAGDVDPSQILSEILEGRREVTLGVPCNKHITIIHFDESEITS